MSASINVLFMLFLSPLNGVPSGTSRRTRCWTPRLSSSWLQAVVRWCRLLLLLHCVVLLHLLLHCAVVGLVCSLPASALAVQFGPLQCEITACVVTARACPTSSSWRCCFVVRLWPCPCSAVLGGGSELWQLPCSLQYSVLYMSGGWQWLLVTFCNTRVCSCYSSALGDGGCSLQRSCTLRVSVLSWLASGSP